MTALSLRHLSKRFGALVVADDICLEIQPRRIHAIIGPNGAGKTTLIHQVFGSVAPDSGSIWMDGRDITHLRPYRRARLGLLRSFQIVSILPEFSVLENAALAVQARAGATWRGFGRAAAIQVFNDRAMAALQQVGLQARTGNLAGRLSHGEKRRLELAILLAAGPKLLLLDEPLAGAGVEEVSRLVDLLRDLAATCTILLVEHDMAAVFALADTISVLAEGRLIATGAPDEIRADPRVRTAYLGLEA